MYALFKDGENLTGKSFFPGLWNYALSNGLAYYRYIDRNDKAEVVLKEGYTIEEIED